jgi:hypothetical protein
MASSALRSRNRLRWLHLTVGAALNTYVYLPPGSAGWLQWSLMLAGVPAVTISGIAMWKGPALRRALRSKGAPVRSPVDPRPVS